MKSCQKVTFRSPKRGVSHTYGGGLTHTYGGGVTQTDLEALKGVFLWTFCQSGSGNAYADEVGANGGMNRKV